MLYIIFLLYICLMFNNNNNAMETFIAIENFKKASEKFDANPNAKTATALSEAREKLERAESDKRVREWEEGKSDFVKKAEKAERDMWAKALKTVRGF